jgi:hypothetical protein
MARDRGDRAGGGATGGGTSAWFGRSVDWDTNAR